MTAKATLIPMVVEKTGNGERAYDIYSRLHKDVLNGILAEASGKIAEAVVQDTDRDHFMSAEEAKAWGIVDNVL